MQRVLVRVAAVLSSLAIAGCYSPSIAPCVYACNGTACPSGLTCNAAIDKCVENAGDTCNPDMTDGSTGDSEACNWPRISNVDPCTPGLQPYFQDDKWTAAGTVSTDDLDTWATQNGVHPVEGSSTNSALVVIAAVKTLTIPQGSTFTVTGTRPLVILVGEAVVIDGQLHFDAASKTVCDGVSLAGSGIQAADNKGAGGGGGGGFGGDGGAGGAGLMPASALEGSPGGMSGKKSGVPENAPLVAGCPGGSGGGLTTVGGGTGGFGGGAIQISTKGTFTLKGVITANGGGGDKPAGPRAAGGGGGSGGAILLEAASIEAPAAANARLCANGGGGGGTGQDGEAANFCGVAAGGTGMTGSNGNGGTGGFGALAMQDGTAGNTPTTTNTPGFAGGGGGGGAGRIRINGTVTATMTVSPEATTGLFPIP